MEELINFFWNLEIRIVPFLTAIMIFEISNIARRLTHIAYTPVYFIFFPLGHADSYYAYYFNEDEMRVGESMSTLEKKRLRKKIQSISAFSMAFSAILNPLLCGTFCAIFLDYKEFVIVFWFIAIVKSAMIAFSLYDNRYTTFVTVSGSYPWLIAIYVSFMVVVLWVLNKTYLWASEIVSQSGAIGIVYSIFDVFIGQILIGIIISGIIGAAISHYMTDEDFIPEVVSDDE